MKKLLKVFGITIALTAIGVGVRAMYRENVNVKITKDAVKVNAPTISLDGSTQLRQSL